MPQPAELQNPTSTSSCAVFSTLILFLPSSDQSRNRSSRLPPAAGTSVPVRRRRGSGPLGSQPVWQLFGSGAVSLFNPPSGIDELDSDDDDGGGGGGGGDDESGIVNGGDDGGDFASK